jgi:hypothetical protein
MTAQLKHPAGRRRAEAALWRAVKAKAGQHGSPGWLPLRWRQASCCRMIGDKQADTD